LSPTVPTVTGPQLHASEGRASASTNGFLHMPAPGNRPGSSLPDHVAVTEPRLVFVSCRAIRGPHADLSGFVRIWARGRRDECRIRQEVARADTESSRGCDPAAVQRLLFGLLAGATPGEILETTLVESRLGRGRTRWVADALRRRRALGDVLVMVSELPRLGASILASELHASVLCPDVEVDGEGRLTGKVAEPLIGAERVAAAARLAATRGTRLSDCSGVGCSWDDLELLRAVGAVDVVGDHPALLRLAGEERWSMMPLDGATELRQLSA
jgi:haloacid dehalogenase-like hydrolase